MSLRTPAAPPKPSRPAPTPAKPAAQGSSSAQAEKRSATNQVKPASPKAAPSAQPPTDHFAPASPKATPPGHPVPSPQGGLEASHPAPTPVTPAVQGHEPAHSAVDSSGDIWATPKTPGQAAGSPYDGLKDQALIQALHDASAEHKDLGYTQARKIIFGALDNHDGKVRDVYTGRELVTNTIPNGSDMNTEHTWPQSQGATGPAKDDLHHLFPVDSKANSIRSSYPFGVVKNVQWSQGGSKFGTDAQGKTVFEPPDEHKGNVARALFYFATVYGKHIPADDEAVLKQWNHQDGVDSAEQKRNDAIQGYQGNRNPYVDDASLADRISDF